VPDGGYKVDSCMKHTVKCRGARQPLLLMFQVPAAQTARMVYGGHPSLAQVNNWGSMGQAAQGVPPLLGL
jgi:hypothetical protein